jgi:hypothetical protein
VQTFTGLQNFTKSFGFSGILFYGYYVFHESLQNFAGFSQNFTGSPRGNQSKINQNQSRKPQFPHPNNQSHSQTKKP